jgi:hypothetical protein
MPADSPGLGGDCRLGFDTRLQTTVMVGRGFDGGLVRQAVRPGHSVKTERNTGVFDGEEKNISRLITEIKDEASLSARAVAKNLLPIVRVHVRE